MTTASPSLTPYIIGGVELTRAEYVFVIEFVKDQNQRRAAKMAGKYRSEDAQQLLDTEKVQGAIAHVLADRLKLINIDAAWLMQEFVDNHFLARNDGKWNASNQALLSIGKLATVDAFAAEKVQVTNATDVVERLQRAHARKKDRPAKPGPTPPNFMR